MKDEAVGKQEYICQKLTEAIQRGQFDDGRLPSDRTLAAMFEVSYMTARRAVGMLVERGLVERHPRRGTYLRLAPAEAEKPNSKLLHVVYTAYQSADYGQLEKAVADECQARGMKYVVTRVAEGGEKAAAAAIIGAHLNLVCMHEYFEWRPIERALVLAANRSVVFGHRLDTQGVLSVIGHDTEAMRMAVTHLAAMGHTQIGYAMHHPNLSQARLRVATWRAVQSHLWSREQLTRRLVVVDIPRFGSQTESAYQAMRQYLAETRERLTALVCINEEVALGVVAASRDAGIAVPEDLSIITLANTSVGRYAHPALSCIEINRNEEVHAALDLVLEHVHERLPAWDRLHLVPPRLVERDSVRRIGPPPMAIS